MILSHELVRIASYQLGRDAINSQFLTPERGFKKSALMRGYVTARPWVYIATEPQRITLRAPDGSIVGTAGLAIDVTEQVRALAAVEASESHYRALVDDATVGIFRSSPEGRFLAVNPALVAMLAAGYRPSRARRATTRR
ncbi:MAG: hypothetical protein HC933_21520 [Pleurocapsa sp. SU_196_0]|nr:hypothetical protein [Pleurocapsa sp. SU_196_0]